VDKRIDVIATAVKAGLKVQDLEEVELAYAPPFGSAKDPVNIAGYVANNLLKGDIETIKWNEIDDLENSVILDIREREEQLLGYIDRPNILNIPLNTLRDNLGKLNKNVTYITYCQVGLRGYLAYRILKNNGFKAKNLDGGFKIYTYATTEIKNNLSQIDKNKSEEFIINEKDTINLDACGLQCPGPILETYKKMNNMQNGQVLQIRATDPGFKKDIQKWADKTGNTFIDVETKDGIVTARVAKGSLNEKIEKEKDNKTMVVFSNDLDKALASMIIANGAATMGKKVTLFFTFWGLNLLRKENYKPKGENFVEKVFGFMMPKGPKKLNYQN